MILGIGINDADYPIRVVEYGGWYGTETHYTYDVSIWRHLPPEGATHVHWYNK